MQNININIATGEITTNIISDVQPTLEELQNQKMAELMNLYKDTIVQGFTSNATGTPLFFTYNAQDQINYSKIANNVALNTALDSILIGSSTGAVTMTRSQFLQFVQDASNYEYGLYNKRVSLETQINNAPDIPTLNGIVIAL